MGLCGITSASRPVSRVLYGTTPRGAARDGHSSGAAVAGRLEQPTRATVGRRTWSLRPVSPLFGLAPGGACHAVPVARPAVRSYRTLSPLPAAPCGGPAVCFLWRCPWGRPRRTLSGTVSLWSPDFPPPVRAAAVRPTGCAEVRARAGAVNGNASFTVSGGHRQGVAQLPRLHRFDRGSSHRLARAAVAALVGRAGGREHVERQCVTS